MHHVLRRLGVASAAALALVVLTAGAASAHVTLDPPSADKGAADQTIVFRVPNEDDAASTTGLRVQFPTDHPIAAVVPLETPGWTATVKKTTLPTPIKTDDGTVTEVVSEIDWSGGKITPDHFGAFTVLAEGLPSDADSLTFKTIQTYDGGKEVAWIEVADASDPNPEHPAPVLKLTAVAEGDDKATTTPGTSPRPSVTEDGETPTTKKAAGATPVTEADGDKVAKGVSNDLADQINSNDASKTQVNIALGLAGLAVVLSGVAIFVARAKPE